jgi:general stress protein 26
MTADLATVTKGIPTEVVEYLYRHHVITLSTSSFTGMPHADTVVYMNDTSSIYFFAGEGTQMLRNIKDSRRVSFTIDDYTIDWRKVRELQGIGRCAPVNRDQDVIAWTLHLAKFGPQTSRPPGYLYAIVPNEMHFVDYDYAVVAGQAAQLRSRVYQIEDAPAPPAQGAVSTNLDRLTYEPGQIVFRPGDSTGEYYVVIDGEVEIRSEGFGADQTVLRLGPGQFFGDQATLRGQQGALTCHAVKRSILLAVDREALRDLLNSGPLYP